MSNIVVPIFDTAGEDENENKNENENENNVPVHVAAARAAYTPGFTQTDDTHTRHRASGNDHPPLPSSSFNCTLDSSNTSQVPDPLARQVTTPLWTGNSGEGHRTHTVDGMRAGNITIGHGGRHRNTSSPEHYREPQSTQDPIQPNRFVSYQESVLWKNTEDEAKDRKMIEEWESTKKCWSGTGQKHVVSKELAFPIDGTDPPSRLGAGAYGVVDKVKYNGVVIVRKTIDRQNLKHPKTLDELREEAKIIEKLAHRHVVTLIGSFTHEENRFLNILTYPVAVCDLEQYLQDFEAIRYQRFDDILAITDRVRRLGFADLQAIDYLDPEVKKELLVAMSIRVMEQLGCVADAMEYVHSMNIKHQDLKPRNIVMSPTKVYITDFGISRVLREPVKHVNDDLSVGYAPPEVNFEDEVHHPSALDVYSLGSIFLNVVALPPGFPRNKCKAVLSSESDSREGEIEGIASEIAALLQQRGAEAQDNHTVSSKHIMGLIKWMLLNDPDERPDMSTVNAQLHVLGGLNQIYHSTCCKRTNAWMASHVNENIRIWEAQIEKRYDEARLRFNKSLEAQQKVVEQNMALQMEVESLRDELRREREYEPATF